MLIGYAGQEAPGWMRRRKLAYEHFKLGRDTAAIAGMFRITEALALQWITTERCLQRSLPNPYQIKVSR